MTFEKLSSLMYEELGTDKLSDIATEFDVSPQVVSNWKSRNQVPYKYVKLFRERIEGRVKQNLENDQMNSFNFDFLSPSSKMDDEEFLESIMPYFKLVYDKYLSILLVTIFSVISSYIYVAYVKTPVYTSVAKIVPVRVPQQSSQMRNLVTSFGVDLGGFNHTSSLTSAEMFPSLIESRSLAESLLEKRFSNKKFGENRSLISILLNSSKEHENWSYKQRKKAVNNLLRKISVIKQKRSPLLTLTAATIDAEFSAQLLEAVIDQVVLKARNHKIASVKQTIEFIKSRLAEVKIELQEKEDALKIFTESNRRIGESATLLLEKDRMSRDLEVTSSLYGSLIREYEKVKIDESRLETYFDILDPPEIPNRPSNINVLGTVLKFTLFGFILSLLIVLMVDSYAKNREKLGAYFK